MNHFKLFLNASTQMIFIVYASLSVLHVFHVSTFLKGWQGQPWQSGQQVYLVCAPLVGWAQQTSNSKTLCGRKCFPSLLSDEQPKRGPGIWELIWNTCTWWSSPLLLQWCLDPANFHTRILVLKSFHWKQEPAPRRALGHFRCRLSVSSTDAYTHRSMLTRTYTAW